MDLVYLDNNATTKPAPRVIEAMQQAQQQFWANPSSIHRHGQLARQQVELARASVASLINTHPRQIVFTSGGTESNNLAIRGVLGDSADAVLITSKLEHSAVREPAEVFGKIGKTVWLPIADGGVIDPQSVADAIREYQDAAGPILISIQWANNETGAIQPIEQIVQVVQQAREQTSSRHGIYLHVDACQMVGKRPVDVSKVEVDLLTLSAHKFHGPKGVGALYVHRGLRLKRQIHGGPQELQRRGGTENTAAIIGFGVAAELAEKFLKDDRQLSALTALRDRFESSLLERIPNAVINAPKDKSPAFRLWNTSNIGFPGIEAEAVLLGLSERGVCASAGAACSSGSLEPSPVLLAMGVPEAVAHGSIRFSLGRETTDREVDRALELIPEVVGRLGRLMPHG